MGRPGLIGRGQINSPARELAALVKAAQPFVTDRGERGPPDPERVQAWKLTAWNIVALQHQPLVAGQWSAGKKAEVGQRLAEQVGHRNQVWLLAGHFQDC